MSDTADPTEPATTPAAASTPASEPAPAAPPSDAPERRSGAVLRFLAALGRPLRYLLRPFIFRVSEDGNKVTFTSYSALVYTWILIPLGLATWLLSSWGWASPTTLGWVQVTAIVMLLILLGDDMGLWAVVVTSMIAALLAFAGHFLREEYDMPVLGWLQRLLSGLEVTYSPGLALALALFAFSILAFYVLPKAWFVGRYEITTREVTHIKRGVAVDSWRRAGRDVKQRWPDVLETLVGVGAGGVYLLDRSHKAVMHIPHVVCLWFYRHEVERVLEKIATSDYDDDADVDDLD